jgi:hypothetical protein
MFVPKNHPNTGHQSPYWYSDSPKGIRDHRKSVPRGHRCFKDLNEQPLYDAEGIIHWATAAANGYLYLQVRPWKRRALTYQELHEPFKYWRAKKFKKLRRTKRRGLSYESRVKPMVYKRAIRVCKRHNTIPCIEIKSPTEIEFRAGRMKRIADALKWEPIFMSLYKMTGIDRKAEAVIHVGGKFVILAHGEPRPHTVPPHTEIWGHFS